MTCYTEDISRALMEKDVVSADPSIPDMRAYTEPEVQAAGFQQQMELVWRQTAMTAMLNALAHELNQPLTAITLHCDAALTTARSAPGANPEMISDIAQAAAGAYQAGKIVASLRRFITKPDPPSGPAQLNRLVEVGAQLAELESGENVTNIDRKLDPQLPELMLNGPQIVHLVLNLLRQSIAACAQADATPCAVMISTKPNDGNADIRITGYGSCRVRELVQLSLLDALQSSEAGLDMAICRTIVDAHNGRLRVEPKGEQQSDIVVSFPMEPGNK